MVSQIFQNITEGLNLSILNHGANTLYHLVLYCDYCSWNSMWLVALVLACSRPIQEERNILGIL